LEQQRDKGLLVLRVGIGIMFMSHGFPKVIGGPESWSGLGSVMTDLGFGYAPTLMGFIAAMSEFGGGLFLALGLFTRTSSFFLMMTMIVATLMHVTQGDSFGRYSHALEAAILFFSLLLIGPGTLSLDSIIFNKSKLPEDDLNKSSSED